MTDHLDAGTRERLDALLADDGKGTAFARLAADPGRVGLESLLAEIGKLELLRRLALPPSLLFGLHPNQVKRFRRRAVVESAWELRRHPERIRWPLLAFYCVPREGEVVDGLVELLIQVTHRITVKAERRVVEELVEEAREVRGKAGILFKVAEAAVDRPDGVVREVIFPVVGEHTFEALVREARALGTPQSRRVHTAMRASYGSYYRRMMPRLLAALDFRSNNGTHRPLLDALDAIRRAEGEGRQYFRAEEIAIEGVIRPKWRDVVVEDAPGGGQRVNRINYEICVLQTLRERLRCKEVWVAGADRFRNPDEDLPADFAAAPDRLLRAPRPAHGGSGRSRKRFGRRWRLRCRNSIAGCRATRASASSRVDGTRSWFDRSNPSPSRRDFGALKVELGRRWPMTGLLDLLKEADLRVGFTDAFATAATREAIDRDEVRRRLLLCLYGLGTNAGLKRLAVGRHGFSYKELLHTRRRYIDADALRDATRRVVNATLAARHPRIWGEGTTACASDSKHFGAFDQNLMTEWHARYGGRGVMIYWHVERGSVCIHSQLRRCSSSEVAAMIEGVLRHDTEMEVERQYVDSHGQSEVAFAFCRLLGFQLLPRLKAIAAQRLYMPEAGGCVVPEPGLHPGAADRLGPDRAAVRRDGALRDRDGRTHRRSRGDLASLHAKQRSAPDLQGARRAGKGSQNLVSVPLSARGRAQARDPRGAERGRDLEQRQWLHLLRQGRRGGEQPVGRPGGLRPRAAPAAVLPGLREHADAAARAGRARVDGAHDAGRCARPYPLVWGHVSPYGTFDLDMEQRLDLDLREAA